MPHPAVIESQVRICLKARKFIYREVRSNLEQYREAPIVEVIYDIRRKDLPDVDQRMRLSARLARALPGGPRPVPGVALRWHGERIRGIDWKLREDVVKDGFVVGLVRGWHEHRWTDTDADRYVINVNRFVKNPDFMGLLRQCLGRWHIEYSVQQLQLKEDRK